MRPSKLLKWATWENCLIAKRKLPTFSWKSGNFLFVIRHLYFLETNKCNKNVISEWRGNEQLLATKKTK